MKKILLFFTLLIFSLNQAFGYVTPDLKLVLSRTIINKDEKFVLSLHFQNLESIDTSKINIEGIQNFSITGTQIDTISTNNNGEKQTKTIIQYILVPKTTGKYLILGPASYDDLLSNKEKIQVLDSVDKEELNDKIGLKSAPAPVITDEELEQMKELNQIGEDENTDTDYIPDGEVSLDNEIIKQEEKNNKLQLIYKIIIGLLGSFLVILLGFLFLGRKKDIPEEKQDIILEYPEITDENFIIKLQSVFIQKVKTNYNFQIENVEYTKLASLLESKKVNVPNIDKICEYFILLKYSKEQNIETKEELTYLIKSI